MSELSLDQPAKLPPPNQIPDIIPGLAGNYLENLAFLSKELGCYARGITLCRGSLGRTFLSLIWSASAILPVEWRLLLDCSVPLRLYFYIFAPSHYPKQHFLYSQLSPYGLSIDRYDFLLIKGVHKSYWGLCWLCPF